MTNIAMNPIAKSIGALSSIAPPHIVMIQLNTLMPLGTAIARVRTMNGTRDVRLIPVVNMWCAHTPNPRKPIATLDRAIALYPKIGLWENRGITSEMIPITGRIMMYTAGWEENQKMCCQMIGAPPSGVARVTTPDVRRTDQTKRERFLNVIPGARRRRIVTTKLSPPRVDEIPISWSPTIQRSTPRLGSNTDRGAYPVHPICAEPIHMMTAAGGRSQ